MAKFQYIAKDAAGQEQRGVIEAGDRASAIASIRASGLMPTAIGEVKGGSSPAPKQEAKKTAKKPAAKKGGGAMNKEINIKMPNFLRPKTVKPKELTTFTRQLATLVNAGLPLMRCIEVLKRQKMAPAMMDCLNCGQPTTPFATARATCLDKASVTLQRKTFFAPSCTVTLQTSHNTARKALQNFLYSESSQVIL
jgi:type II secretory pathway component PulF